MVTKREDEDFECENLIGGQTCGKQAPDVQLRAIPMMPGMRYFICDECLEEKQELVNYLKKKRGENE